ncbi:MAG: hypothetical protein IKN55_10545 [Oscillospiraceae bacterium]|nr:hypothetical protein [Oscillospiraceae bacterium]
MENMYFPIRIELHIVLALLAFLVFGLQFIRFHKSHHLVLAIALPCTLLPYLSQNKTLFYAVGIAELIALVGACVLANTVDRDKEAVAAEDGEQDTASQEDET